MIGVAGNQAVSHWPAAVPSGPRPVAIIGTGTVGGEVLRLLRDRHLPGLRLCALANSRRMLLSEAVIDPGEAPVLLPHAERLTCLETLAEHLRRQGEGGAVVDLTASPAVADRHADWLRRGLHVVTANKWAMAAEAAGFAPLREALDRAEGCYRHATTVGAGLPLLDTLQRLHRAGDPVLSVAGLFSGTLTYLTQGLAAGRAFSACLREAHARGLTEPDPRLDLSGLDVARKLVIAARAAGIALDPTQVTVDSLCPEAVADWPLADFLAEAGPCLDDYWAACRARAPEGVPRFVGEVDHQGRARVGLRYLGLDHPFVAVGPTDNVFEIRSASYADTPIVIRGPGAGSRVTAMQVLGDLLSLPA